MPELSTIQIFYTILLVTTFLTQGVIAAWVYRYQWDRSGSKWFLIMVGTGMVWVLPYTFFFVVTNPTYQYVAHGIGFFGILSTVCAFVVFASKYTEAGFHHNRLIQAHLVAIIGGYLLLAPTNNMHHLLFADFRAVSEPFSYIAVQRGVVFWGMLLSLQIPGLYAYYRLVTNLRSSHRHGGRQLIMFTIGALSINTLDYVDHLTTLLPMDGFPDALLGMFLFYMLVAVALFRFNLLEVKPVARKTIIENLHDPVLVIEEQNRLVDFNEAAMAVWPALSDHLLDRFETACPEVKAAIETPLEGTFTTELTIERDGMEHYYSVTASAVTADGAETGWYSIVLREITDRREREQELEELTTRLQLALDETSTGVWEWDLDTDDVIWDEASERLFGYEPGAFPGTFAGFADRVPDEDLEQVHERAEHAIETGEEYRLEFRVRPPESNQRWVQARGVVEYDDEGEPGRLLGIQTDITERKLREEELREAKRTLEQSNEKLEQFAGMVSHDLRNPLNVIKGRAGLLRSEAPEEHVEPIEHSVDRMETIIDDVLTLSRAGESVDDPEPVSVATLVADCWLTVSSDDMELERSFPDDVEVEADGNRLRQVFENLFRNAKEHNDPPVTIRVGTLSDETGSMSGFFVADDGTGIPDSDREKVFEQGYTTNTDGTGFGLSIVEEIIEAHGWTISITESDAGGVRFEVQMTGQS